MRERGARKHSGTFSGHIHFGIKALGMSTWNCTPFAKSVHLGMHPQLKTTGLLVLPLPLPRTRRGCKSWTDSGLLPGSPQSPSDSSQCFPDQAASSDNDSDIGSPCQYLRPRGTRQKWKEPISHGRHQAGRGKHVETLWSRQSNL